MNPDETPKALLRERIRGLQERNRELEDLHAGLMAQLVQGQKLQALGQLSAAIAHEVSNPLNYVLANLSVLQKHVAALAQLASAPPATDLRGGVEQTVEQMRLAIDESREGGARMLDLVKNLKEFARIDERDPEPADLHRVLEAAVRLCWYEMKHRVRLVREFHPVRPVPCHAQRLSQVFVNLLLNALHAIEESGRGMGVVRIVTQERGGEAIVEIHDNGVGIPETSLAHLFEPFFTTKPVGKGMGLGLYVAHRIIEAHQGTIEAHSVFGQGTTFLVRLPLGLA